ncbi:SdrD B-like domain-containing protein, partial [Agromyces sp. NPDC060279]|uniref:SdrD B-like domain-containing protein n=1 Tax=Agromyces sp. NPDC060279 TaxID=3347092 RepID=UPI0036464B45
MIASGAVVALGLTAGGLAAVTTAHAAEQNGYVFNDAWSLTGPSSETQYSPASPAHNAATSALPTRTGSVGVTAEFSPNGSRSPGGAVLTNGTDQSAYGATAAMFTGAPDPARLPALGFYGLASEGCGGPLGSAAHQNFADECAIGQLTLTFDRPVTDVVLDLSGVGGYAGQWIDSYARGSFNSTVWSIASDGVQFAGLSSAATNLSMTPTTLRVTNDNTWNMCNAQGRIGSGDTNSPRSDFAGCGSVQLTGTFTSVTFDLSSRAVPFSTFPAASHGTGSRYFQNDGTQYADGTNGLNTVRSETTLLPNASRTNQNADLQRVSLRLPQLGSIGDRVWLDADRNGVRSDDEAGVAGVTVELLDADGNPVTDANGNLITAVTGSDGAYRFTDLPYGDYQLRFTDPDGRQWSPQGAGEDAARDSDVDPASGQTGTVRIDSANPEANNIDAGLMDPLPEASDDRSDGNTIGDAVTVPTLDNDRGDLDPTTVRITDPETGDPVT